MQQDRRFFLGALGAAALSSAFPAVAQVAGRDYTPVNPPQPTDEPGKIEVLEFFSYGCPHCHDFHPMISAWAAKQPADVAFRRIPVSFNRAAWGNVARLFYTLEALGELARLDNAVFQAIHDERRNLFDERSAAEWVAGKGVDAKKFSDAFNSFTVVSKTRRADQIAQAYRVGGVPSMAVNGKYFISDHPFEETLAIVDRLIAKSRSEKTGKK